MVPGSKKKLHCLMLLTALLLLFYAPPARSEGNNSARINSLGGNSVSGIILDFYTDLAINPAYAHLTDTLTLNYGYRVSPSKKLPFHLIDRNYNFYFPTTSSYRTNELLAYGIRLSDWRLSVSSEWYIHNDDETKSTVSQLYGSNNFSYRNLIRTTHSIYDNNYWHLALSAAHSLGGSNRIGVRLGGTEYYKNSTYNSTTFSKYYTQSSISGATYLSEDNSVYNVDSSITRWLSIYLRIGLILGEDIRKNSEIVFEIARSPIFSRHNNYDLGIEYYYESNSDLHSYYYNLKEWMDRKEGNIWSLALSGRHTFPNGVRTYLGGEFETSSYESDWVNMLRGYRWYTHVTDVSQYTTFAAEGDFKRIFFFVKAGKTFNVLEDLDITAGFKSFFERYSNSEEPLAQFRAENINDQVREETQLSQQALFEFDNTMIELLVPLALEYSPLDYLSCFAGFSCNIVWKRKTEEFIMPIFLSGDEELTIPYGESADSGYITSPIKNCRDEIDLYDAVTVGFSVNYKNRFSIDLYTGSDITPDKISNMIIDARFRF